MEENIRIGKISFCGREENREGKGGTYLGTENIVFGRREKQGRKGKKIFGERKKCLGGEGKGGK